MHKSRADKIIITLVLVSVLVIGGIGNAEQRLQKSLSSIAPHFSYTLPPATKPTSLLWPSIGQSAIGATGYGVLATKGAQTPIPTASVAKLITALTVLKDKPLTGTAQGPTLVLGQSDVDIYKAYKSVGGSVAAVTVGEQITEYQVLQAMLLPSANNMADSLAIWAYGSLVAYATAGNSLLASYGLVNTHVGSDASGFQPDSTSTASDIVKLGEIALNNPTIADIVSQSNATIPVAGNVKNVNWLLGTNGINGMKTGNSDQVGGNFLFSAKYTPAVGHDITIVGAVMGTNSLSQAMDGAVPLLSSAQKAFSLSTVFTAGQVIGSYQVPWASSVSAVVSKDVKALAWQGQIIDKPDVVLKDLKAPADKGQTVGSINTSLTSESSNIVLSQSVAKPSVWWRLTHY